MSVYHLKDFSGEQLKISQFAGLAGEDIPMCFFVLFEYWSRSMQMLAWKEMIVSFSLPDSGIVASYRNIMNYVFAVTWDRSKVG